MYCLTVCRPYPYAGGGEKRAFELLKHFDNFGFTPILYIPYSDLLSAVILEEIYNLKKFVHVLKELERFNVIIPTELFDHLDNINRNIQYNLDHFRKRNMSTALSSIIRSIYSIREFKTNLTLAKTSITKLIHGDGINLNRLKFVYSMQEHPSIVVTGAFLAKSLSRNLFIQLQLEPFRPFREFVINDWISRVTFSEQPILREITRLSLIALQHTFQNPRYSYSYAFRNNLAGLLAVSEAPLLVSGLDSWASKRGLKVKIVRPGNAVDEDISKEYISEKERRQLLRKKEDVAVFFARLRASKGLFDIPPIAKKLAIEGYRLLMIGRFDHIIEKRIFFRICKEKGIKNIEYLGWLSRDDLFKIVSRTKVLIYPSHSDSFSLVVLEALLLGCSVVAYDIPAIRSVYKGLKPVRIVREYDYKAMAEEVMRILKRDISEHEEEHLDEGFMNFLKMHSSWRNVAKADIEAIKDMINLRSS